MPHSKPLRGVSFIRKVDANADPFSELDNRGGVDNPKRMLEGWTAWARRGRELRPGTTNDDLQFEASIGRYVTSPAALLHILAERRRAVAIISARGTNYKNEEGSWGGTGFIVAPNLFLTNHHVLNSIKVATEAAVEFDFEITPENLLLGEGRPTPAPKTFKLDPARLFITSPTLGGLDYTFVWIEDAAAKTFGTIEMERASFTVNKGDQAFLVHHPDGQHKQVSLDDTDVVATEATVIHYTSDSLEGSSGAPVFDRRGRLIALHHASRRVDPAIALPDGGTADRVNEGIKIAAIAIELETRAASRGPEAAYAETILKNIKGSDTLSGFFGASGRMTRADTLGPEAVVDVYRGSDRDIDIGFWNIEWLANRWQQPGKLEGAAKIIADLNLDAWGLLEISPPAIKALVDTLSRTYSERYDYALSEPDASAGKQSTAMIWKRSSLEGGRVDWPEDIEPLLKQRSDDPNLQVEAVHGKIFDRYPALYYFKTAKAPEYSFYAVPLHLKAMDEGSLRRRLASRIIARACEQLAAEEPIDIILGGDMNAPLASGDFTAIEQARFLLLGAKDEAEGAFSYVKSPKSAIDNIFLSPGMKQTVGKIDYFIVAKDRTMPDYLAISDHRPVAVRLTIGTSDTAGRALDQSALDAIIDARLGGSEKKSRKAQAAASPPESEQPVPGQAKHAGAAKKKKKAPKAKKASATRAKKARKR